MEDYNYEAYRNHPEALPEELSGSRRLWLFDLMLYHNQHSTEANQSCANKENSDVLAGNEGKLNRLYNRK